MVSYYSILQYVHDPVKDERINVGVFAFDQTRCKFVHTDNWSHLKCVCGSQCILAVKEAVRDLRYWGEKEVRKFADSPFGNFNMTFPSASVLTPEELLLYISKRVLPANAATQIDYRVKSQVVRDVRRQFREKLKRKFGPGGVALLRDRDRLIFSTNVPVNPDIAVGNGDAEVQTVVQVLSFEEQDHNKVQRDVSATGFIIRSIKEANDPISKARIGVVYVPPKTGASEMKNYFDLAIDEFKKNAELIDVSKMNDWAGRQVDGLRVTV